MFNVFRDLSDVNEGNILNVFENIFTHTRFDSIFNDKPLSPTQYPLRQIPLRVPCPTNPRPHPTRTTHELPIVLPEFNGYGMCKQD